MSRVLRDGGSYVHGVCSFMEYVHALIRKEIVV